ncbi:hypothetical protein FBZ89_12733 [Nitrospirillum amazonense]|uniref:Uncharacterized protein n=1 Tax=Nitrospirillum amazonense TaxID=28077 RepID=A0A560ERA0_9PROT|nr:hypothetical protein [Nitrospirillum amazonense]TWB11899.1 hypothetical protein FBZ89_12733 [Nitrospirillum amazonense]
MKHRIPARLAIALAVLAFSAASGTALAAAKPKHEPAKPPAKAKDLNGWGQVTWGMTHKQILAAYPKAREFEIGNGAPKGGQVRYLFGLESIRLGGCAYAVDFEMKKNALRRVTLYGQEASKDCGDGVDAQLVKQLGAPAGRQKDAESASAEWKAGHTKVTLRRGIGKAARKVAPVVEYMPK